ncbi:MAG: alpha/beta hydrolase [Candidatus Ventricola sp.]
MIRRIWLLGLALLILLAAAAGCALRASSLLGMVLDGRRTLQAGENTLSHFRLLEQTVGSQADVRTNGWLAVVSEETVSMDTARGTLSASLYPPVLGEADTPWAIVLHGGLGTDRTQVRDVACRLSLHGYRVLTPDLYAHGASDGTVSALGVRDADDVLAWAEWILARDDDARIVLFGQDEGATAVLVAARGELPDAVVAAAADSACRSADERLERLLEQALPGASAPDRALLRLGYRMAHGLSAHAGDLTGSTYQLPLLLVHGTGDEEVPAWHSEDIAAAAGESARLLFVEGAGHGMARYVDEAAYYEALLGFFDVALGGHDDAASNEKGLSGES